MGKADLSIKVFSPQKCFQSFSYTCKWFCAAQCQSFLLVFLHCTSRLTSTSAPFCYAPATCATSRYMTQDDTTSCGMFPQTVLKLFIQFSKLGGFCLIVLFTCGIFLKLVHHCPAHCCIYFYFHSILKFKKKILHE